MYEGRLEVCVDRQWGTVCDDFWTDEDASVAYKQLGFSQNSMSHTVASLFVG